MRYATDTRFFLVPFFTLLWAGNAWSQSLQLKSEQAMAGVPFELTAVAKGFGKAQPQLAVPDIEGCQTKLAGVSPNHVSKISVVNGRRKEWSESSFTFHFKVVCAKSGEFQIPAMVATDGQKRAVSPATVLQVGDVKSSDNMELELVVPNRPVWLGEAFAIVVNWYLTNDVNDVSFSIPLLENEDWVEVEAEGVAGRKEGEFRFPIGSHTLTVPYGRQQVVRNGKRVTRIQFRFKVTPHQAGTLEIPPSLVTANLAVGHTRDRFGFRTPRWEMFKSSSAAHSLQVQAPPSSGRPKSFSNAVGAGYTIKVEASQTVVKVGDPIELTITIASKSRLAGLRLPPLGKMGLDPDVFSLPMEVPAGTILEDEQEKEFLVSVRLKKKNVSEIPALEFAYFDPKTRSYSVAKSQAVALSVQGSAVIAADEVVSGRPKKTQTSEEGSHFVSLVGADLSLSSETDTLTPVMTMDSIRPWVIGFYALPLIVFFFLVGRARGRSSRGERENIKRAHQKVMSLVKEADTKPAKECAPGLINALRDLRREAALSSSEGRDLLSELETVGYDPTKGGAPLSKPTIDACKQLASAWRKHAQGTIGAGVRGTSAMLFFLLFCFAFAAHAQNATLAKARQNYQNALAEKDHSKRTAYFAAAKEFFGTSAKEHRRSPELLVDWGNAALGAYELGTATLAYRRALVLDPANGRAAKNLDWVRERSPDWLPAPTEDGAMDSFFFWHRTMSEAQKQLAGSFFFALFLLALAPWGRKRKGLRKVAPIFALMWIGLLGSALAQTNFGNDVVVVERELKMHSADSPGAPLALQQPLPTGAELRVVERRGDWSRVALADGRMGWIRQSGVEKVVQ